MDAEMDAVASTPTLGMDAVDAGMDAGPTAASTPATTPDQRKHPGMDAVDAMDAGMQPLSNTASWWLYSHPAGTNTCAGCRSTEPVFRYPAPPGRAKSFPGSTDWCAACLRDQFADRNSSSRLPRCAACSEPMPPVEPGQITHPGCEAAGDQP